MLVNTTKEAVVPIVDLLADYTSRTVEEIIQGLVEIFLRVLDEFIIQPGPLEETSEDQGDVFLKAVFSSLLLHDLLIVPRILL